MCLRLVQRISIALCNRRLLGQQFEFFDERFLVLQQRLDQLELRLVMSASTVPEEPALIRIRTLLDLLSRRIRSPAEHASHARLQAQAEGALAELLDALGELDEYPLRQAFAERFPSQIEE